MTLDRLAILVYEIDQRCDEDLELLLSDLLCTAWPTFRAQRQ
jgi:hypothetical protein